MAGGSMAKGVGSPCLFSISFYLYCTIPALAPSFMFSNVPTLFL